MENAKAVKGLHKIQDLNGKVYSCGHQLSSVHARSLDSKYYNSKQKSSFIRDLGDIYILDFQKTFFNSNDH